MNIMIYANTEQEVEQIKNNTLDSKIAILPLKLLDALITKADDCEVRVIDLVIDKKLVFQD